MRLRAGIVRPIIASTVQARQRYLFLAGHGAEQSDQPLRRSPGKYAYNPSDKRSKAVGEIVSDLELEGIPLSDDTIRRYLKEARDLLNEWQQQV
jgi:hypothetical protein